MVTGALGILVLLVIGMVGLALAMRGGRAVRQTRWPRWVEPVLRGVCGAGAVAIVGGVSWMTWNDIQAPYRAARFDPVTVHVPTADMEQALAANPKWRGADGTLTEARLVGQIVVVDLAGGRLQVVSASEVDAHWSPGGRLSGRVWVEGGTVEYDVRIEKLAIQRDKANEEARLTGEARVDATFNSYRFSTSGTAFPRDDLGMLYLTHMPPTGIGTAFSLARRPLWPTSRYAVLRLRVAGPLDPLKPAPALDCLAGYAPLLEAIGPETSWDSLSFPVRIRTQDDKPPALVFFDHFGSAAWLALLAGFMAARAIRRRPGWLLLVTLPLSVLFVAAWDCAGAGVHERKLVDRALLPRTRAAACVQTADTFFCRKTAGLALRRVSEEAAAPAVLRKVSARLSYLLKTKWSRARREFQYEQSTSVNVRHADRGGWAMGRDVEVRLFLGERQQPRLMCFWSEGVGLSVDQEKAAFILSQPGTEGRMVMLGTDLRARVIGTEADFRWALQAMNDRGPMGLERSEMFQKVVVPALQQLEKEDPPAPR